VNAQPALSRNVELKLSGHEPDRSLADLEAKYGPMSPPDGKP
jgi:hypothetical protein